MDLSTYEWWWVAVVAAAAMLGVALVLIYPAMGLRKYVRIMINLMEDYTPMPENGGSDNGQLKGEEVSFRAADGHRLAGIVVQHRAGVPTRGMVVFAHEVGSDRTSCLRYCRPLLDVGYDVFAFDFRGHGASPPEEGYRPRQWPSDREKSDMLGAITFIGSYLQQRGRSRDVGLFGISRGAGAAVLASGGIACVRAIVTDGVFSSDTTLEYLMRRFAPIFAGIRIVAENFPPMVWRFFRWLLFRECVRKFNCRFPSVRKAIVRMGPKPILFIHGEKDSYIPIAQSQILYNLARGSRDLWIVPGTTHNQGVRVHPEEYARRVLRFFDEHLASVESVVRTNCETRPLDEPVRVAPGESGELSPACLGTYAGVSMEQVPNKR